MLKQRILTALFLIPIFVFLILKLSPPAFYLFSAAIVIWGAWEWSPFMGLTKFPHCFFYPILVTFLLLFSLGVNIVPILFLAAAFWLIALVLVLTYPNSCRYWGKSIAIRGLMGLFVLIPCWRAINFIFQSPNGPYTLLFLFVLIWGADSGAYFIGRKWGKRKLAPQVSPGKTWEGLLGALITTTIIALISFRLFDIPLNFWWKAAVLCLITVLVSVLGDLFESMLKRNAGLKDSGQLIPGHGGLLDRIDSITAAVPIFALGALFLR